MTPGPRRPVRSNKQDLSLTKEMANNNALDSRPVFFFDIDNCVSVYFVFFLLRFFKRNPTPSPNWQKNIYKPPLPRRTSPSPSAEFCQLTVPPAKKKKKALFTQYVALFQSPYSSSRTNDADGIE